jgi:hypothetical protein
MLPEALLAEQLQQANVVNTFIQLIPPNSTDSRLFSLAMSIKDICDRADAVQAWSVMSYLIHWWYRGEHDGYLLPDTITVTLLFAKRGRAQIVELLDQCILPRFIEVSRRRRLDCFTHGDMIALFSAMMACDDSRLGLIATLVPTFLSWIESNEVRTRESYGLIAALVERFPYCLGTVC